MRTFIFPYVFECEGKAGIFSLDDADLSKRTSTDDA